MKKGCNGEWKKWVKNGMENHDDKLGLSWAKLKLLSRSLICSWQLKLQSKLEFNYLQWWVGGCVRKNKINAYSTQLKLKFELSLVKTVLHFHHCQSTALRRRPTATSTAHANFANLFPMNLLSFSKYLTFLDAYGPKGPVQGGKLDKCHFFI